MSLATTDVFRWTESYSVNIDSLDRQHQDLFAAINELEQALRAGEGNAAVQKILGKVASYAADHFAAEESLMQKHNFPGLSSHREQHQMFRSKITTLIEDYRASKSGVPVCLLFFLHTWLKDHLLKTDKLYTAYLNARGVR